MRDTPFIILTADDCALVRSEAIRAGALAVVRKPFAWPDLLGAIQDGAGRMYSGWMDRRRWTRFPVASRRPAAPSSDSPVKILAVEDDPVARAVLRQGLLRLGHEVVEAPDGRTAWDVLQKQPFRVVVSDWVMPAADGLELCRRVRGRIGGEYVYFILLTSSDATEHNQRAAADAGVDDFLTKPLDLTELWTRLRVAERILRYTTQVRQLEELLPICTYCKKIRDDHNYWQQMEGYINQRTGSEFSHSICPDCYQRVVIPQLETFRKNPPADHGGVT